MAFLERIGFIETPEQEQARLAQAPEGSVNHYLSTLPVTIEGWLMDELIELPWNEPRTTQPYRVVVVPFEFHMEGGDDGSTPRKRHSGHWDCIVVSSDHPSYPVGGYRIVVSSAELARGKRIELDAVRGLAAPSNISLGDMLIEVRQMTGGNPRQ